MLKIQPYPIRDPGSAVQFLEQCLEGGERLPAQATAAEKEMLVTGEASRFLFVRYGLLEYMSAAYGAACHAAFEGAVACMMAHPLLELPGRFQPTAAQLGFDLAVALSCRRHERASTLATQILRGPVSADAPEDWRAQVLAALLDLDYERAANGINRMREATKAANLARHDALVLSLWIKIADCVAARTDLALSVSLDELSRQRGAYLDKMLARWSKGQNTELSPLDFWDCHTTGLMVIAASYGLTQEAEGMPFANWRWTETAHQWA